MALQTQLFVVYIVWHCRHNCMLCIWFGIADTNLAGFQCMNCLTKKVAFSNKSTSLASMIQVNVSKVSSNCFTFGMSWYTIDDQACKWKHKVRCNMLTGLYISFHFYVMQLSCQNVFHYSGTPQNRNLRKPEFPRKLYNWLGPKCSAFFSLYINPGKPEPLYSGNRKKVYIH